MLEEIKVSREASRSKQNEKTVGDKTVHEMEY